MSKTFVDITIVISLLVCIIGFVYITIVHVKTNKQIREYYKNNKN